MKSYTITVKGTSIRLVVAYVDGKLLSIDNIKELDGQAWDLIRNWISVNERVTVTRFDVLMAVPGSVIELKRLKG